jgi:hypothetical protein
VVQSVGLFVIDRNIMKPNKRHLLIAGFACLGVAGYFLSAFRESRQYEPKSEAHRSDSESSWGVSPFASGPIDQTEHRARNHTTMKNLETVAVYGRNGRTIDLGGKNVASYIAQWSSLARTGDMEAAYKIYQAADVCANNDEALPDFQAESQRVQFLNDHAALEKLCAGVTPAQVQERMTFLTLAARAGNADAQIDYFMEGPYGRPANLADNADDPAVMKWKEDAVAYLKAASGQGQTFALALLSSAYDVGGLVPQDAKMSLAYAVADATARNATVSPAQLRNRFGAQMSDEDYTNALQLGSQIASDCCKH